MKRNQIVAWTLVGVLGIVATMLALEVFVKSPTKQTHRAARPISEAPKFTGKPELPKPPLPTGSTERRTADDWRPSEELKEPVVEMPAQPSSHQSALQRRFQEAQDAFVKKGIERQVGLAANENKKLDNRTARKINETLGTVETPESVAEMERRDVELAKLIKMRNSYEISPEVCAERAVEILNGDRLTAGEPTK